MKIIDKMADETTQSRPQWTTYEVKPEYRGGGVLVVHKLADGTRQAAYFSKPPRGIGGFFSIQRIYRGVNTMKIPSRKVETYSNESLDDLILQRRTQ